MAYCLLFSHYVLSDCFVTPWTVACQSPLPMGFPRQEYWSGFLFFPSRRSSQSSDQTHISCLDEWFLYHWATWEIRKVATIGIIPVFILEPKPLRVSIPWSWKSQLLHRCSSTFWISFFFHFCFLSCRIWHLTGRDSANTFLCHV